ncbi:MAG: hypothetical protein ACLFQK_07445 [Fibrobacterota bacterium]
MDTGKKVWETAYKNGQERSGNRIFSAVINTKAQRGAGNLFETSESIVDREKENSKKALEELWLLKKNSKTGETETLDLLIEYYQEKLDTVRLKEEKISKISKHSLDLLDERKIKGREIAQLSQELKDCIQEIKFLSAKKDRLEKKESELKADDAKIQKELLQNEGDVLGGLYNIIMANEELKKPVKETVSSAPPQEALSEKASAPGSEMSVRKRPLEVLETGDVDLSNTEQLILQPPPLLEKPPFPKSVVKTDAGKVLGEYYYDSALFKEKRQYIFNSRFFLDQLSSAVKICTRKYSEPVYMDMLLMCVDIQNRVKNRPNIHFEISTNEILNPQSLNLLIQNIKSKDFGEVLKYCDRLAAKTNKLGQNYNSILKEQMSSFSSTD